MCLLWSVIVHMACNDRYCCDVMIDICEYMPASDTLHICGYSFTSRPISHILQFPVTMSKDSIIIRIYYASL